MKEERKNAFVFLDNVENQQEKVQQIINKIGVDFQFDIYPADISISSARGLVQMLNEKNCKAEVINLANEFTEKAREIRESYMDYIANWPRKAMIEGENFLEIFLDRTDLSLWWLAEPSQKNIEGSPTYNRICQILTALDQFVNNGYSKFILISRDVAINKIFEKQIGSSKFLSISVKDDSKSQTRHLRDKARQRINGYIFLSNWVFKVVFAKLFGRKQKLRNFIPKSPTIFYSWFVEEQFTKRDEELLDRYYVDLPKYLLDRGEEVLFLNQMRTDPKETLKYLRAARRNFKEGIFDSKFPEYYTERFFFIEEFLPLYQLIRILIKGKSIRKKYLGLRDKTFFKASFMFNGIDFFELFVRDFDDAFLKMRITDILLQSAAVEEFCRYTQPRNQICWSTLYNWGRGITVGAKRGYPAVKVIGLQESRITTMVLYYCYRPIEIRVIPSTPGWIDSMPVPDKYILHSESNEKIFLSSGFDKDQLLIAGAPRFQMIASHQKDRLNNHEKLKRERMSQNTSLKYLVVLGTSILKDDSDDLIELFFNAIRTMKDIWVVVKPHPFNVRNVANKVKEITKRLKFDNYEIDTGDIQVLLTAADLIVTSYSGTGGEAVAIGCPSINVHIGNRVSITPFDDFPEASFQANTISELHKVILVVLTDPMKSKEILTKREEFVNYCFGPLDGKSNERIYNFICNKRIIRI